MENIITRKMTQIKYHMRKLPQFDRDDPKYQETERKWRKLFLKWFGLGVLNISLTLVLFSLCFISLVGMSRDSEDTSILGSYFLSFFVACYFAKGIMND